MITCGQIIVVIIVFLFCMLIVATALDDDVGASEAE